MFLIIYENENGKGWRKANKQENVDKFINENHLDDDPCFYDVIDLSNTELKTEIEMLKNKITAIKEILLTQ